jgi:hypothetical protein
LPLLGTRNADGQPAALQNGVESTPPRRRCKRAILAAMPLSVQHRHAVVFAGRTHDAGVITTVVSEVLMASPGTNLFEIEQVFRDSNSAAYLVATTEGFVVVLSAMAMLVAVSKAGMTVEQNRAALATCRPWPAPTGSAN